MHVLLMQFGKSYVGRLRPNFVDMCQPDWHAIGVDCSLPENADVVITNAHCRAGDEWHEQSRCRYAHARV